MQQEKIVIELQTKMVTLKLTQFDTDIDADELTNIQYYNIIGEILTFPVIMNRIGNLKADIEQVVAEAKLDFQIFEANEQEKQRKALTFATEGSKGETKTNKPTKDEVENAVLISREYRVKKTNLFKIQRNLAYVESLYWAAKDKSDKLNYFSSKLKPEEFEKEILEGTINGVMILVNKKSIQ
jgi:hypothetical protein